MLNKTFGIVSCALKPLHLIDNGWERFWIDFKIFLVLKVKRALNAFYFVASISIAEIFTV
jgi:hypothetical protein